MIKETREGILIFIITTLIMLLASEFLVRIFFGNHLQYKVDKELYWELKPNQYGYSSLGLPYAHINSDGFRGEELTKDPDKQRVMMLGCSNTFGQALSDKETLSNQLQEMLGTNYEVINAGTPGWGLFQGLEKFKRIESLYNPKFLVLTLISHSYFRQPFKTQEEKERYLKRMEIRAFFMKSALICFVTDLIQKIVGTNFGSTANFLTKNSDVEAVWKEDKKRLWELKEITDRKGIKFIVVGYTRMGPKDESFLNLLKEFQKESGVKFIINLNEIFSAYSKDDLHAKNDSHPSAIANKVVAEQILKLIKN